VPCRTARVVSGGVGAVQVGMDTLLVQVFVMSQCSEPVIGQELNFSAACDVSGSSGGLQV